MSDQGEKPQVSQYKPIPEDYGTPLPKRTPINFAKRKAALAKSN